MLVFMPSVLKKKNTPSAMKILRPYFQFPKVLDGLFALAKKIFDINVVAADGNVDVWHEDVRYFEVQDLQGQRIANFYLDPYSRPAEKRGGAWMNAFYTHVKKWTRIFNLLWPYWFATKLIHPWVISLHS